MSREMTNSEAIANLNHIYGFVSPNIQRSLDVAFKALEERTQGEWQVVGRIMKNGKPLAVRCSRCDKSPKYAVRSDFCPNCGAKMKND